MGRICPKIHKVIPSMKREGEKTAESRLRRQVAGVC